MEKRGAATAANGRWPPGARLMQMQGADSLSLSVMTSSSGFPVPSPLACRGRQTDRQQAGQAGQPPCEQNGRGCLITRARMPFVILKPDITASTDVFSSVQLSWGGSRRRRAVVGLCLATAPGAARSSRWPARAPGNCPKRSPASDDLLRAASRRERREKARTASLVGFPGPGKRDLKEAVAPAPRPFPFPDYVAMTGPGDCSDPVVISRRRPDQVEHKHASTNWQQTRNARRPITNQITGRAVFLSFSQHSVGSRASSAT